LKKIIRGKAWILETYSLIYLSIPQMGLRREQEKKLYNHHLSSQFFDFVKVVFKVNTIFATLP
jgi:hypothetical protein